MNSHLSLCTYLAPDTDQQEFFPKMLTGNLVSHWGGDVPLVKLSNSLQMFWPGSAGHNMQHLKSRPVDH